MIGYKLVSGRGIFRPCTQHALQSVKYKLNKKTIRSTGAGPFAVFDTYEHACKFHYDTNLGEIILIIKYKKSKHNTLWKTINNHIILYNLLCFPRGTNFADWIIPLGIIHKKTIVS